MAKPLALDLFSGAGGLSLGLHWAGFRTIGAIEIDPIAASSYSHNHPGVHIWNSDIRKVSSASIFRELNLKKGELDLLAGCPPCQGFSRLRTKNGRRTNHDPRNDLIEQMGRFVRGLRPKAIMLENVPALSRDERFEALIKDLKKRNYSVKWDILNAENYGVPQRRKRLVMLASRVGSISFPSSLLPKTTVREAIGSLGEPSASLDPLHNVHENRKESVQKIIELIPKDGGSRGDLPNKYQLKCHQRMQGFHDIYGRLAWDTVAPTITSGCLNPSKGRFIHPSQNRAITPREAAILQSFPEDYWFSAKRGKGHLALQIGNAFPPRMIEQIANPTHFGLWQ